MARTNNKRLKAPHRSKPQNRGDQGWQKGAGNQFTYQNSFLDVEEREKNVHDNKRHEKVLSEEQLNK